MSKVKLCGLTRLEDILIVNKLLPEYIGFVFVKKSKRYISVDSAKQLKNKLDKRVKAVGVFVDEDINIIKSIASLEIIDMIQLHGNEDNDYIKQLKQVCDKPIIKAVQIKSNDDIVFATNSLADYILLDSGKGTGKTFDWSLINNIKRPYFLAGGLDENNVKQAIKQLNPFGVDVSSNIETNGVKDEIKMKNFVENSRNGE